MRLHVVALFVFSLSTAVVLAQDEPPAPTLPDVVVRPGQSAPPTFYEPSSGGFDDGSIDWNSNLIQSDNTLVGSYGQPVWTTQRPFATTRVYVLPEGQAQVEQWVRPTYPRGEKPEYRFLEELAIGLPGRFQLDLYERWNVEPNEQNQEEANHEGVQVELRWAVADWDVIPLNPTFYIEWLERGGPQEKPNKYEAKLLLGDELTESLFYATNFIIEQEVEGDERETELAWTNAISTPLIDRVLLAGIEMNLQGTTVKGERDDAEISFTIGPSLQLRPTNRTFLDVVGLFGTTPESPDAQLYVIFGYQFGDRAGPSNNIGRGASGRGN